MHVFFVLVPNYVANYGVFVSNFMSRITLFWCHILTLQKAAGAKIGFFSKSGKCISKYACHNFLEGLRDKFIGWLVGRLIG